MRSKNQQFYQRIHRKTSFWKTQTLDQMKPKISLSIQNYINRILKKSNQVLKRDEKRQNDVLNTRFSGDFARIITTKACNLTWVSKKRRKVPKRCVKNTSSPADLARIITEFPENARQDSNYYIAIQKKKREAESEITSSITLLFVKIESGSKKRQKKQQNDV